MCPKCGNEESVLQSVVSAEWECLPELGGCGAVFSKPARQSEEHQCRVEDSVRAMTEAMRNFEHRECPLGRPSLLEMEQRTTELLELLRTEIGRLATLPGDPA